MSSTSFQNGILETPISLQDGGTGVSLADPNNDRILFWDDSAGELTWLTVGYGLSLVGTTLTASGGGSGTVTSVSVVSANGFAGSVATDTTTPAITLSTTITGLLKGNGTAISAAVSGTDYAPATSGTSILKGNGSGGFSNASAGTDYEVPLTFSTGLTRTTNTVTVNTTQNIAKLSNLTTNGFVKTSGGDGTLSIDTNTYITGNQTITLSGDITGSGTTGITTAIAAGVIVNADVNASAGITLSKLAALTVSRALVSDGSGVISVSSVTSTELGYLSGVTSAIQTQLNAKVDDGAVTTSGLTMATSRILGRTTASTGAIEELTAGSSLSLSAGSLDTIQDIRTTANPQFATIELGAATDTTLSRVSAGVIAVEGVTVATASNTLTLSGKTLTAPKFADLGYIADANGNEMIIFDTVASAVNEITLANAATTGTPTISATGGDTNINLQLTPKGTGIVKGELKRFMVRLLANTTDTATGTTIGGDYRISNRAITVKAVGAYVDTAGTTNTTTIDINEAGTTILSTKITIDSTEKSSETAATAPVISDTAIAADAVVTFDIDAISTTPAKGLTVWVDYVYA